MTLVTGIMLALTILCGLATLLFVLRGLLLRSTQARQPYDVARQQARRDMQVQYVRAAFSLILTLILLGIYGLASGNSTLTQGATETPEPGPTVTQVKATSSPAQAATSTMQPTAVELTATATTSPTVTATATQTPAPETVRVNSPNGLWLREAPGGSQQLELIADGTELVPLSGRETADDIEWQQVRTPAGNEGWVAVEFLIFGN